MSEGVQDKELADAIENLCALASRRVLALGDRDLKAGIVVEGSARAQQIVEGLAHQAHEARELSLLRVVTYQTELLAAQPYLDPQSQLARRVGFALRDLERELRSRYGARRFGDRVELSTLEQLKPVALRLVDDVPRSQAERLVERMSLLAGEVTTALTSVQVVGAVDSERATELPSALKPLLAQARWHSWESAYPADDSSIESSPSLALQQLAAALPAAAFGDATARMAVQRSAVLLGSTDGQLSDDLPITGDTDVDRAMAVVHRDFWRLSQRYHESYTFTEAEREGISSEVVDNAIAANGFLKALPAAEKAPSVQPALRGLPGRPGPARQHGPITSANPARKAP